MKDINDGGNTDISGNIENLSIITNLANSKKLDLIKYKKSKSKKLDLIKQNFPKANFFQINILILEVKKVFILLWKTFIKVPVLKHFDLEFYIFIKTNGIKYFIIEILS